MRGLMVLSIAACLLGPRHATAEPKAERPVSFQYDVLAALSKQGCSAGACHGSPSGKGGFRLSLRGFDAALDRQTLLREAFGRRVNRFDPKQSLLLRKPTMEVPHGGGRQLREHDLAYEILYRWISEGCSLKADAARCEQILVTPEREEIALPASPTQLQVSAVFSDGAKRDITKLAIYRSSNEKVAVVDAFGRVTPKGKGNATILVRYLDYITTAEFTFLRNDEGFVWNEKPAELEMDRLVLTRLRKLQIPPSPLCDDNAFIRRLYLDVLGILPTRDEVEVFLADDSPDKREQLIDRVLERPEYAEFWAQKRADLLRIRASKVGVEGVKRFHQWLVDRVAENQPYDQFATALLTSLGSTLDNPAANYFRAAGDEKDCAETTSQLFLGVRIQCAKCHNHPSDRWSQDNYYGIAAVFGQVERTTVKGQDAVAISLKPEADVVQPRTGKSMKPWLPLTGEVDVPAGDDRRRVFAEWLTDSNNPFFARVAVNRIWAHLMGRGLVDPVDDFSAVNPPSHPDVLDHLALEFVAMGYDQKALLRRILVSRTYQRSSQTNTLNADDDRYFSHALARMLSAEQLLDAISHVTGANEEFVGLPEVTRATALPSPDFGNDFLRTFGQPARNSACDCERQGSPNLARALQLVNGRLIPTKLRDRRGRIGRLYDDLPGRLRAAGEPPREGRVAWFRADSVSGKDAQPARNGSSVERWENLDDPQRSVIQLNGDQQPRLIAAALAGLPAVRFDGTNDLLHNTEMDLLASGAARTIVLVGRMRDAGGGAVFTFGRSRTGGASVFTAQHVRVSGTYYVYSDGVNGAGNTTAPDTGFSDLQRPFVTTYLSGGAGQKLQVRVNGQDLKLTQSGNVGPDQGSKGFTIASREDLPLGSQLWGGDIAEILIFDHVLSPEHLLSVERYLATKYDLPATSNARPSTTVSNPQPELIRKTIVDAYFAAFSRQPTNSELDAALNHVKTSANIRGALEDVFWALLNSREFLFQH